MEAGLALGLDLLTVTGTIAQQDEGGTTTIDIANVIETVTVIEEDAVDGNDQGAEARINQQNKPSLSSLKMNATSVPCLFSSLPPDYVLKN